jgi:CDP-diacylglycerol--glycerol-3-phosphate 3-phosphatidyltransferase
MRPDESSMSDPQDERRRRPRKLNVPNVLCVIRLMAAAAMAVFAVTGRSAAFVLALIVALASDWLDGKLAIVLDQRTSFGARLDSVADAFMYLSLLFGAFLLKADVVRSELPWIVVALASHAMSLVIALRKFGRWPSYHTWCAKLSWWLVAMGTIAAFADWTLWPFRLAMVAVVITNMESIAITRVMNHWSADVRSISQAKASRDAPP